MLIGIQKTKIMAFSPIPSLQIDGGEIETVNRFYLGSKITWMVTAVMNLKDTFSLEEKL